MKIDADTLEDFNKQKFLVRRGMEVYGGSFVKALGFALQYADPINSQIIKNAFPEYWKKYLEMGKKLIELQKEGD